MAEIVSGVPQQIGDVWIGATNFSEFEVGAGAPTGISALVAGPPHGPNDVQIADDVDPTIGHYLRFSPVGPLGASFFTIDAFDSVGVTTGEILGLFYVSTRTNGSASHSPGIARMFGPPVTGANSYLGSALNDPSGGGQRVSSFVLRRSDGAVEDLAATDPFDTPAAGWYWLRQRLEEVAEGEYRLSVKFWWRGDEEPEAFDVVYTLDVTDNSVVDALVDGGNVGVGVAAPALTNVAEMRVAELRFTTDPDMVPALGVGEDPNPEPSVIPEQREKAWAFVLDGHVFYVLNFTSRPALIHDLTTGQWHEWFTREFDPDDPGFEPGGFWNMFRGIVWKGRVIAADAADPVVWELDPHSMLDEGVDPIRRAVTAFQPLRGRASARQGSLRLTATKEDVSESATIRMRFSDDGGSSWSSWRSVTLAADSVSRRIEWRSLGRVRAPGRIWEIEDTGGLVRIEGTDSDMEGEDE